MRPTGILILPAIKMEPTSGNAPDCSVYKTEVARLAYRQNGPYGTSCTLTGRVLSAVPLLLGYVGMAWRERLPLSSYGFGDRGFGIKLPPHEMVRAPGFAPRSSEWQSESLLLTYARIKPKRTDTLGSTLSGHRISRWSV